MARLKHTDYKAIGAHLLFWLAYILYSAIDEGRGSRDTWSFSLSPQILTELPVAVLVVYSNLCFLMPAFYAKYKYVHYISGLLLLLLMAGLSGRFFSWWIWLPQERLQDPASREPTEFWIMVRVVKDSVDNFPVVTATMIIQLMRNANQREKKLRQIEKEKFTAEMSLLKAQINPHFFFNTLNSLYALTLAGSKRSPDVVLRLSNLMRYMLYEAGAGRVLLTDEIRHLENYISIEQMRFADRLDLSFQYSGDLDDKVIAPLLLLPFIENAFKHGVGENSGWITIDLKVTGNRLFLKVENSCKSGANVKPEGLGLINVERRLELIYPGQYELYFGQNNELYFVDLKISL